MSDGDQSDSPDDYLSRAVEQAAASMSLGTPGGAMVEECPVVGRCVVQLQHADGELLSEPALVRLDGPVQRERETAPDTERADFENLPQGDYEVTVDLRGEESSAFECEQPYPDYFEITHPCQETTILFDIVPLRDSKTIRYLVWDGVECTDGTLNQDYEQQERPDSPRGLRPDVQLKRVEGPQSRLHQVWIEIEVSNLADLEEGVNLEIFDASNELVYSERLSQIQLLNLPDEKPDPENEKPTPSLIPCDGKEYEISRCLGSGGQGAVYLLTNTAAPDDRLVLKVFASEGATDLDSEDLEKRVRLEIEKPVTESVEKALAAYQTELEEAASLFDDEDWEEMKDDYGAKDTEEAREAYLKEALADTFQDDLTLWRLSYFTGSMSRDVLGIEVRQLKQANERLFSEEETAELFKLVGQGEAEKCREIVREIVLRKRVDLLLQQVQESERTVDKEAEMHERASGHENVVTFKGLADVRNLVTRYAGSAFEVFVSTEDENRDHRPESQKFSVSGHLAPKGVLMEYCEGGDLEEAFEELRTLYDQSKISHSEFWGAVQALFKDLLEGLKHLEESGIVHSDIKGANLVLDSEGVAKLADFGVSDTAGELQRGYTPAFLAPEQSTFGEEERLNPKMDPYAAGQVVHAVPSGQKHDQTEEDVLPDSPKTAYVSLVRQLLQYDKEKRWSAATALEESEFVKDPLLQKEDARKVIKKMLAGREGT